MNCVVWSVNNGNVADKFGISTGILVTLHAHVTALVMTLVTYTFCC